MFTNRRRKAIIAELTKYCQAIRARRTETFESQGEICSVVKPPVYTFGVQELDLRQAYPIVRSVEK